MMMIMMMKMLKVGLFDLMMMIMVLMVMQIYEKMRAMAKIKIYQCQDDIDERGNKTDCDHDQEKVREMVSLLIGLQHFDFGQRSPSRLRSCQKRKGLPTKI